MYKIMQAIINNKVTYQLMFVDVTSKESKYKENMKVSEQKRNRTCQHKIGLVTDDDH
jgi:hypothetical protein